MHRDRLTVIKGENGTEKPSSNLGQASLCFLSANASRKHEFISLHHFPLPDKNGLSLAWHDD